ncbi:2TM domain-containing protein [Winogradskyella eximia]|jgi:2TM domain|uniref:2TM domain-containing protein n=1 Tax=Winogradskyella eximia TaxID=262006 RepID=A0A3D9GZQ9_9FLAO|nr:2TM domain-containing protein [Winogradskyella eximia]RED42740.1 2TM domain-containing protein [Winogradskyella eximia]|tara:strand:+ start:3791 stop:4108 length:318 start_codon:yes stop_codon:yes gene_type:complete
MNQDLKKQQLRKAKDKVRKVKVFYIHLAGYVVVVALLLYNLYIVAGPYKNNIISLNLSVLVGWTVFIIIHGLNVFKGKRIFKKSWEDKKTAQFLKDKEEEKTFWE